MVVNELRGEKIDVIRWSPDPATYISNALSPARVDEVRLISPDDRQAHVLVPEDQLSLAIGKEGQNVRLAARLTGWKIDIKDSGKYDYDAEDRKIAELMAAREAAAREAEELAAEEAEAEVWKAAALAERAAAIAAAAAELEASELETDPEADSDIDADADSPGPVVEASEVSLGEEPQPLTEEEE